MYLDFKEMLHSYVEEKQTNICQISAMKDGKLCYEDCWHNYKTEDTFHVMSVTKSVVSILIGIAIDKGLIESVDSKVLDFFPDYQVKRGEKTIKQVTLRHLLTMTAPYKYKSEPWTKVCTSDDWTIAALDLLGGRSGITSEFKYSTLGIHILTGIIYKVSGKNTIEFANEYLFAPLGIADHKSYYAETSEEHKNFIFSKEPKGNIWFSDPKDIPTAGYGLCLSASDMVKIGQMLLNNGIYNNRRIVSKEWIDECTASHFQCDEHFGNMQYGYLFWIIGDDDFSAIGDGGNVIYMNRKENTVVAVTSTFKPTVFDRVDVIKTKIVPFL